MVNNMLILLSLFLAQAAFAQEIIVNGTVTDEDDVPLPGVNISIEGTSEGTSTDFDGNYEIEVEQGQALKFSSVGFADQTITVEDENELNVVLEEGSALDEVVVTALGIEREEKALTSAQQSITSDEISKTKQPNFLRSLSGKISGLNIHIVPQEWGDLQK